MDERMIDGLTGTVRQRETVRIRDKIEREMDERMIDGLRGREDDRWTDWYSETVDERVIDGLTGSSVDTGRRERGTRSRGRWKRG